jgi:hypothetical protein
LALVRRHCHPLLYLERKAYLAALRDALAGVETARVILARACQRLDGQDDAEKEGQNERRQGWVRA